jgi:hypothetical protein
MSVCTYVCTYVYLQGLHEAVHVQKARFIHGIHAKLDVSDVCVYVWQVVRSHIPHAVYCRPTCSKEHSTYGMQADMSMYLCAHVCALCALAKILSKE